MKRPEIMEDLEKLYRGEVSASGWAGDAAEETVRHFSKSLQVPQEQIFNEIALDTARGFLSGNLSWDFVDWVANKCLFSGVTDLGLNGGTTENPALWWEVFLAFDHSETVGGEYSRVARDELLEVLSRHGLTP